MRIDILAYGALSGEAEVHVGVDGRGGVGLLIALRTSSRAPSRSAARSSRGSPSIGEQFKDAIADDLNMPQAMAAVYELIREADRRGEYGVLDALYDFDRVLGLKLRESAERATSVDAEVEALIKERERGAGGQELGPRRRDTKTARRARGDAGGYALRHTVAQSGLIIGAES